MPVYTTCTIRGGKKGEGKYKFLSNFLQLNSNVSALQSIGMDKRHKKCHILVPFQTYVRRYDEGAANYVISYSDLLIKRGIK